MEQINWTFIILVVILLIIVFVVYDFHKIGGFNPKIRRHLNRKGVGLNGLLTEEDDMFDSDSDSDSD